MNYTLTNRVIRLLVKKWYGVEITKEIAATIAAEVESEYPEDEYDNVPECGLCDIICEVLGAYGIENDYVG